MVACRSVTNAACPRTAYLNQRWSKLCLLITKWTWIGL